MAKGIWVVKEMERHLGAAAGDRMAGSLGGSQEERRVAEKAVREKAGTEGELLKAGTEGGPLALEDRAAEVLVGGRAVKGGAAAEATGVMGAEARARGGTGMEARARGAARSSGRSCSMW